MKHSGSRSHDEEVDVFDFDLPEDRIALRPASPRDSARLLVVRADGHLDHCRVSDLPDLLRAGDLLVANDTRVQPAALKGFRPPRDASGAGADIDVTLHQRRGDAEWAAFARPAKRLKTGDTVLFQRQHSPTAAPLLKATVTTLDQGEVLLAFEVAGAALDREIERVGEVPLPPYLLSKRAVDHRDRTDYQTMFATEPGSVAAPTAGLHFTPDLIARLTGAGVPLRTITLHVGAGTFLPVKATQLAAHRMHTERFVVSEDVVDDIRVARESGGRCIAVGTTVLRSLETASLAGELRAADGDTSLFITPGFQFRSVDGLLTNFHLPRSTLFVLVCALMGTDVMKRAYAHAIEQGYRFYSYGDACLLLPDARV